MFTQKLEGTKHVGLWPLPISANRDLSVPPMPALRWRKQGRNMDIGAVVTAYGSSWNEPDEAARRKLLEAAWANDGTYCDPTANVEGREALVAHIGAMQVAMPGHTIDLVTGVDEHDGHFRFGWAMHGPDGSAVLEGMDYGRLAEDGRLQQIVGFFGPFPTPDRS
jgi:hypothetical protein